MKKLLRFLLVVTIVAALISSSAFAELYLVDGSKVRLRTSPEVTKDNILATLEEGEKVSVFSFTEDGWAKVLYNKETGYISQDFLRLCPYAAYAKSKVNLREGPDTSYDSLAVLPKRTAVKVIAKEGKWYRVIFDGRTGYIRSDFLTEIDTGESEVLGVFTTFFSGPKGRDKNIKKAAGFLNEYVIEPRTDFSILSVIGPINKEGGYFKAKEHQKNDDGSTSVVDGYGGGVCQVSTTLYQSILAAQDAKSRIKITKRSSHSLAVGYIEEGRDATISWEDGVDFAFFNKNYYALKIVTFIRSGSLTCIIAKD